VKRIYLYLLILILAHLFFLSNLQFTAWPEMTSYAYLFNNGFHLYNDIVYPYPPLLMLILSLIYSLFGYQLLVIKIVTWSLLIVTDIIVFKLVKLVSRSGLHALLSVLFFILLQPFLEGNMLWFDIAIVPFIIAGTYYLVKHFCTRKGQPQQSRNTLVFAGLFLGIGVLIKQTVGLYLIAAVLYLLFTNRGKLKFAVREVARFASSPVIIGVVSLIGLGMTNSLTNFFNWTLIYPSQYWTNFPNYVEMSLERREFQIILILMAPVVYFVLLKWKKLKKDKSIQIIMIFLFISFFTVYPRFSFFHFQTSLTLIVILYGVSMKTKYFPVILITIFLLLAPLVYKPAYYLQWGREARFYGSYESTLRSNILKSAPVGSVYFLGIHSGMYSYLDYVPPKPWFDNFGWYLEIPDVQDEILRRWEITPPNTIYWSEPGRGEWYDLGVYQPEMITSWIKENYNNEAIVQEGINKWVRKN